MKIEIRPTYGNYACETEHYLSLVSALASITIRDHKGNTIETYLCSSCVDEMIESLQKIIAGEPVDKE